MGRGHVQGALAKDPAVKTEVQSVQDLRRRQRDSRPSLPRSPADGPGSAGARASAGPLVVFCGIDNMVYEASRGLEAWWAGLTSWTHNVLHGRF